MLDEQQLIAGCIRNDLAAQKELYERFAPKMMLVCMRYSKDKVEAEDILQEGFFKVFDKISQFKRKGSFEGWVRRIMVNTALKNHRKTSKMYAVVELDEARNKAADTSILSQYGFEDLLKLIQSLPENYRVVFNLYIMEGYTHQEIAKMCGMAEGTSKSNLARARAMLKELLTKIEEKDERFYK